MAATVVVDSIADLRANFRNVNAGASNGEWQVRGSSASTPTQNTGPGNNNGFDYCYTETSSITGTLIEAGNNGTLEFTTVPAGTDRRLRLRLCMQGEWGDGNEGMLIQHRGSSGGWVSLPFICGWAYSNEYDAGDTLTDECGDTQTVAANGGWVDFTVNIPDTATRVRMRPRYVVGPGGSSYNHDVGFREFQWLEDTQPSFPTPVPAQTWYVGQRVNLQLPRPVGGDPPITFSDSRGAGFPEDYSFDEDTFVLTALPTEAAASFTWTLTAIDADIDIAQLSVTGRILDPPALTFTGTVADQYLEVGRAASIQLPRPTGGVGTITRTLTPSVLPAGLSYDPSLIRITGTPTAAVSFQTFTWTATDSSTPPQRASISFAVRIAARGVPLAGHRGLEVRLNGTELGGVLTGSVRIANRLEVSNSAIFRMSQATGGTIPANGDEVQVLDRATRRVLFAGNIRNPRWRGLISDSWIRVDAAAIGAGRRLRDRLIPPADGVRIAKMTTGQAQVVALVGLFSGEGFTLDGTVGDLAPIPDDVRLQSVESVLSRLLDTGDFIFTVSNDKVVRVRARGSLPTSALIAGPDNVSLISTETDASNHRTRQWVRHGIVTGKRTFNGDGRSRRFPVVVSSAEELDFFSDSATTTAKNADRDRGLRWRFDARAAIRTDLNGGIDFVGGNALTAASGTVYMGEVGYPPTGVDVEEAGGAGTLMSMEIPAAPTFLPGYALGIRHTASGDVWTFEDQRIVDSYGGNNVRREASQDRLLDTIGRMTSTPDRLWVVSGRTARAYHFNGVRDAARDVTFTGLIHSIAGIGNRLYALTGELSIGGSAFPVAFEVEVRDANTKNEITQTGAPSFLNRPDDGTLIWDLAVGGGIVWMLRGTTEAARRGGNTLGWKAEAYDQDDWTRLTDRDITVNTPEDTQIAATRLYVWGNHLYYRGQRNWHTAYNMSTGESEAAHVVDSFNLTRPTIGEGEEPVAGNSRLWIRPSSTSGQLRAWRLGRARGQFRKPTTTEALAMRSRLSQDDRFRVILMDASVPGVSATRARYEPVSVDVQEITSLSVDGTDIELGGSGWHFDAATQELAIHIGSVGTPTTSQQIIIEWVGRALALASKEGLAVDRLTEFEGQDALRFDEAQRAAQILLGQHGEVAERLIVRFVWGTPIHVEVGQRLQIDSSLAAKYGVKNPTGADRWLVSEVVITEQGDLIRYEVRCIRDRFQQRWADFWRSIARN